MAALSLAPAAARWGVVLVLVLALGCGGGRDPGRAAPPARWSPPWLAAERAAYLDDAAARRAALEASLTNPTNTYSQHRLGSYGLRTVGWDLLPVWNPRSRTLDDAAITTLAGGAAPDVPPAPLWDGVRPGDEAGWIGLGRRVFFEYPLRPEFAIEHLLTGPGVATPAERLVRASAAGIERGADGTFPGLVVFRAVDGLTRVGITCALCHSAHRGPALVEGTARRQFDLGALRLAYYRDTGAPLAPALAARMAAWGPGRADVTEDEDEDPVAIPELWALRERRFLTQAGTIRHVGPAALAIRQETQLLHAGGERTRPPRELAWALAMYLYSLTPPAPPRHAGGGVTTHARGQALFDQHCADCHRDVGHGGDAIPVARIGTDRALAEGKARGTGRYRTPALLDLAQTAPYLHDGSIGSLDELLAPARLAPDYAAGRLGPGPVRGHEFGTSLEPAERDALRAYLSTL
ncbi:MAG: c-type cytochrome [Kofleriaceae bacterium]|nr:c-type cytochrome [Kofleriaceae bacterium]